MYWTCWIRYRTSERHFFQASLGLVWLNSFLETICLPSRALATCPAYKKLSLKQFVFSIDSAVTLNFRLSSEHLHIFLNQLTDVTPSFLFLDLSVVSRNNGLAAKSASWTLSGTRRSADDDVEPRAAFSTCAKVDTFVLKEGMTFRDLEALVEKGRYDELLGLVGDFVSRV